MPHWRNNMNVITFRNVHFFFAVELLFYFTYFIYSTWQEIPILPCALGPPSVMARLYSSCMHKINKHETFEIAEPFFKTHLTRGCFIFYAKLRTIEHVQTCEIHCNNVIGQAVQYLVIWRSIALLLLPCQKKQLIPLGKFPIGTNSKIFNHKLVHN